MEGELLCFSVLRALLLTRLPPGGLKCPVCSFVYGTKWEFNRHLKNKHGLKLVESEGEPKWEVRLRSVVLTLTFLNADTNQASPGPGRRQSLGTLGFLAGKFGVFSSRVSYRRGVTGWGLGHAASLPPGGV